jgi:hypothetical protein
MSPSISRRSFLKVGIIGAITLASAGALYRTMRSAAPPDRFLLDGEAESALRAISASMLRDAILLGSAQEIQSEIDRIQEAIAGLPLNTQKEIQDLFSLLAVAPARRFLAGIPNQWQNARQEDVAAFLQKWRTHRFTMLQSAYHALHDLIIGSWYADPSTWASIGYPGPIKELS